LSKGREESMEAGLDVLAAFPAFAPNSAGRVADRARLTIDAINQTFPQLRSLIGSSGRNIIEPMEIADISATSEDRQAAEELKRCFNAFGSDKASIHDYHHLYGHILRDRDNIGAVFEVGLGTNNRSIVSNMGVEGRPGASLRAFRDFCPRAQVWGADVDRQILFEEERIRTVFVDQTDPETFKQLEPLLPAHLDLVIDDGLHAPHANLATLAFGLSRIRRGGWVVIEDISAAAISLWQCVAAILPEPLEPRLLRARKGFLFAVRRG
jgi:hypothetical protein